MDEARAAIRARGDEPVELAATLTASELADGARGLDADAEQVAANPPICPDPDGRIDRDTDGLVALSSAVAWDTTGGTKTATVHLTLEPNALRDVHWTNDAGPLAVWIGAPELPEGWRASRRLLVHPGPDGGPETSAEPRRLDVEVQLPSDSSGGTLAGFALYYVCEGAGECVYRRLDFQVDLRR